ncbi:MAG: DUF5009 domain-containing protein [Cyclobacteriaceae bacterium]|nr:DUF5009 domain-containing protein [Cyclobacteriaceae bacterium]
MTSTSNSRLISLDVLRGLTIAGMVIVNDPGSWSFVYPPLRHAEWNGATPTDLVFPFFLFFVGVSITLAYTKLVNKGADRKEMYKKLITRSLKIYFLGMLLWFVHRIPGVFTDFSFGDVRYAGVLQRIAVVYLAASLIFLNTNWKQQLKIGAGILVGYWIIMAFIPVPGIGMPDLSVPKLNWANYLDSIALPGSMYQKTWDPEGLLSTFPSIVNSIIGMLAGFLILSETDSSKKIMKLFLMGFLMFLAGNAWGWVFPINKHIWTSSFVLYTSGLASMALATCIWLIDVKGYEKWAFLGKVYGANAITSYVLSGLLTMIFYRGLNKSFMSTLTEMGVQAELASFLYALIYMLIIFIPALILYRKKIFIKL